MYSYAHSIILLEGIQERSDKDRIIIIIFINF